MLNGKIIICANSIEEAEADLAMMKAMAATGAVVGCGATTIEGMRGLAEALAPMITDTEPCGVARLAEPQNPFVCCGCDDDDEEVVENSASELFELYYDGHLSLDELKSSINKLLRKCEKDKREMHNEDTEDESEGFTIESAMAYFFGGEWD
jgi:hypothetical protein